MIKTAVGEGEKISEETKQYDRFFTRLFINSIHENHVFFLFIFFYHFRQSLWMYKSAALKTKIPRVYANT